MGGAVTYSDISLWLENSGDDLVPRPALPGDLDVDVAIVGAGFTGLWTAYYLTERDPSLRVAVLEREVAGFGASGRNGGWASGLFPVSRTRLASLPGSSRAHAVAMTAAMRQCVDEVGRVVAAERIDCDFSKGGTVVLARTEAQLVRAREEVQAAYAWGDTEDDIRLLDPDEAAGKIRASRTLAATYTPHCARIHPAKLVRGLARVVEGRGVSIYEQTRVQALAPSIVRTDRGRVRAQYVVRATEGFTPELEGMKRAVIPVYSLVVATEPLPSSVWDEIGLSTFPTFSDHRHLIIYGQRSADDRLVFGGRGAPYHFSSSIEPEFDRNATVFAGLRETLVDLFPAVAGHEFTHQWGGPLGIARDWMASVGLDRGTGIGWAGGYVGDGVSTTNLAGRTLADLVTGTDSELVSLPWVNHRSRAWEPEPLRWLGVNAGLRTMTAADHEERLTGRASVLARAMAPFVGGR
jgi:glycine/D-amino acid oxidase-like deaminating enzyme